jgi:hypothetical protein
MGGEKNYRGHLRQYLIPVIEVFINHRFFSYSQFFSLWSKSMDCNVSILIYSTPLGFVLKSHTTRHQKLIHFGGYFIYFHGISALSILPFDWNITLAL